MQEFQPHKRATAPNTPSNYGQGQPSNRLPTQPKREGKASKVNRISKFMANRKGRM